MSESLLEMGATKPALEFKHFPTTFQAVVWRNWGMVPVERLAKALEATPDDIIRIGEEMGLSHDDSLCNVWLTRGYQTIIRLNWHLVTYEQLLVMLGWTDDYLSFILREDDFLWVKMGNFKPTVEAPKVRALSEEEKAMTAEIREFSSTLRNHLPNPVERPFDFLTTIHADGPADNSAPGLRMLYSYSALYGDPLIDETLDPFPDNMLDAYAAAGINALWMQAVLYSLVPWMDDDPKTAAYSAGWEKRTENLRRLCKRMAARGIKLMLYLNEPRSLPDEFFEDHPDWRGEHARNAARSALCTSVPDVLERLRKGVETLFRNVPELGGLFCITMSENLTNCWSKSSMEMLPKCPRCKGRNPADVVAEVLQALEAGAHAVNPTAEVIAWSWAWQKPWDEELIAKLPKGVKLMCVSENALPTNVGGCPGKVNDYSISKPGPGPTAQRMWAVARKAGVPCVAKTQFNNTWELSAVPYLPVPGLVEEHINNLRALGIKDFMVSWTLGGYPGGNIRLLTKSKQQLTEEDFGDAAPLILKAYDTFDESFRHFPFDNCYTIYTAPQNYGPQNLLFEEPTGYKATMVGFPYDDLESWHSPTYSDDIFEPEFGILSEGWGRGCAMLREAAAYVDDVHQKAYKELCRVAEAAFCHFQSTYLQICFVRRRNAGDKAGMVAALREESMVTRRLITLLREDSRIGFEASNHYYYNENSLIEKLLNCRRLLSLLNK